MPRQRIRNIRMVTAPFFIAEEILFYGLGGNPQLVLLQAVNPNRALFPKRTHKGLYGPWRWREQQLFINGEFMGKGHCSPGILCRGERYRCRSDHSVVPEEVIGRFPDIFSEDDRGTGWNARYRDDRCHSTSLSV